MLGVAEQLDQLSLSPSKPARTGPSTSTSAVHNPYSPSLTPGQLASIDTSLSSAVAALVHHLTQPLSSLYPHNIILSLRSVLTGIFIERYESTWRPLDPAFGTGYRSLICGRPYGLPKSLRQAAEHVGVDMEKWRLALRGKRREEGPMEDRERDEWEAWCDPGMVTWRYGNWKYFESEFDPVRPIPESIMTIWKAGPAGSVFEPSAVSTQTLTPARPSAAIPIRAPSVLFIPATPAHTAIPTVPAPPRPDSPTLMPAASIGSSSPRSRSSSSAYTDRSRSPSSESESAHPNQARPARSGHRISTGSSSSIDSTISDSASGHSGQTQLLTPASRPGTADPFTAAANAKAELGNDDDKTPTYGQTRGRDPSPVGINLNGMRQVTPTALTPGGRTTPAVTPYDGGNVTVLGGGVKLGGGTGTASRPGSVVSQHRIPLVDRSRSPSISLASRALNSALTPGETAQPGTTTSTGRKPRTRRRIMPTYLGYVGQPGVGGPVGNAFQPMMKIPAGQAVGQFGQQQPIGGMQGQQGPWMGGVRQPLTRIA